jgi:TIGR03009 family protein
MPRRQTILVSPLVSLVAMGCALAVAQDRGNPVAQQDRPPQNAKRPAQNAQPFPPEAMDELLRQWEGQSAKLETLEVDIYRIDRDMAWGDETQFVGHAAFKSPDLAYVDYRAIELKAQPDPKVKNKMVFAPVQKNGQLVSKPFETILCTGTEVWHYRSDVKRLIIWALNNEARKKALDEGPLPFLFRMKAGDAKQRYQMTLRLQDKKSSLVMILPRMKEDMDVFSTAWVTLDREFLLPTRIVLVSPDKAKQQDFRLSKHNANAADGVNPKFFVGVKPNKPWTVEINPFVPDAAPADAKRARRGVDPRAAQRPAPGQGAIQR